MPGFPPIPVEVALPGDVHFLTRNFIVNFQQLRFEEPGLYSVDIRFDDKTETSIPLLVKLMPPGEGGSGTDSGPHYTRGRQS